MNDKNDNPVPIFPRPFRHACFKSARLKYKTVQLMKRLLLQWLIPVRAVRTIEIRTIGLATVLVLFFMSMSTYPVQAVPVKTSEKTSTEKTEKREKKNKKNPAASAATLSRESDDRVQNNTLNANQKTKPLEPETSGHDTPETRLAPGDELRIQSTALAPKVIETTVLSDGSIRLPIIGRVDVAQKTLPQLRSVLLTRFQAYYYMDDLTLTLTAQHPIRLYISGAVANPGVYISGKDLSPEGKTQAELGRVKKNLPPGITRLSQLILLAGGLQNNADLQHIAIYREDPDVYNRDTDNPDLNNKKSRAMVTDLGTEKPPFMEINLLAGLVSTNKTQAASSLPDILLQDNDTVYIPALSSVEQTTQSDDRSAALMKARSNISQQRFTVSVLGGVNKPGMASVKTGATVLTAIAKTGGFSVTADQAAIYILRQSADRQKIKKIRISLTDKALLGKKKSSQWLAVQPNDKIYVAPSPRQEAGHFSLDLLTHHIIGTAFFPLFNNWVQTDQ
ncbi:MAG: SLBB domain-containing protein [Cyanobacteria bacterium P01_H01_bin.74]